MDQKQTGLFIAEVRKKLGLTQSQLAERIGVTNKTISRWETGKYMPDLATIQTLCAELYISVNEFLSGEYLIDHNIKEETDKNIISIVETYELLKKRKHISDFCSGAGTGILFSALYCPDTIRKIIIICIAATLIALGWFYRSKLDKNILQMSSSKDIDSNVT